MRLFEDRTEAAGFDVVTWSGGKEKNHILESTGNGVLLLDYDADGFLDVYFVNAIRLLPERKTEPHSNTLYRNRGDGTFVDVTRDAGVGSSAFGVGGAVADVDNDGLLDIYVTNWGPNTLFRNNGDGTFTDRTESSGVGDPRWSVGAVFFDPDEDGDADLFVANYIETSWEEVWNAKRVRLWRGRVNVLDGPRGLAGAAIRTTATRGTERSPMRPKPPGFLAGSGQYTMGVVSFDYDEDGDVDLYTANDSMPNCLYRNRGDGDFRRGGSSLGRRLQRRRSDPGKHGNRRRRLRQRRALRSRRDELRPRLRHALPEPRRKLRRPLLRRRSRRPDVRARSAGESTSWMWTATWTSTSSCPTVTSILRWTAIPC